MALLVYIAKAFGTKDESIKKYGFRDQWFTPIKEFVIKRDDKLTNTDSEKARTLWMHRRKETGWPCGVCQTSRDKRAKLCPVKQECFSGEYPREITWMQRGVIRDKRGELL